MEVQEKEANVCGPYQLSTESQKARVGGERAGRKVWDEAEARACRQPSLVIEFTDIN